MKTKTKSSDPRREAKISFESELEDKNSDNNLTIIWGTVMEIIRRKDLNIVCTDTVLKTDPWRHNLDEVTIHNDRLWRAVHIMKQKILPDNYTHDNVSYSSMDLLQDINYNLVHLLNDLQDPESVKEYKFDSQRDFFHMKKSKVFPLW